MKHGVAIVTGASQGIGRSTAIRLARDFGAVVLAARNAKELDEVAARVKELDAEALLVGVCPGGTYPGPEALLAVAISHLIGDVRWRFACLGFIAGVV